MSNQTSFSQIEDVRQAETLGEIAQNGIVHPAPGFGITGVKYSFVTN